MSQEGYSPEKKEGESKVVLEKLQTYLKDKRGPEVGEAGASYATQAGTSFELNVHVPMLEDSSNLLRDILNHKKAELLRSPEVKELLQSVASDLKK